MFKNSRFEEDRKRGKMGKDNEIKMRNQKENARKRRIGKGRIKMKNENIRKRKNSKKKVSKKDKKE